MTMNPSDSDLGVPPASLTEKPIDVLPQDVAVNYLLVFFVQDYVSQEEFEQVMRADLQTKQEKVAEWKAGQL